MQSVCVLREVGDMVISGRGTRFLFCHFKGEACEGERVRGGF